MNIDESILSKLTYEQKKKGEAAQSLDELKALAKEEGYELSPEQLKDVDGGNKWIKMLGQLYAVYILLIHGQAKQQIRFGRL